MSREDILEIGSATAKALDKDCKNKWRWDWLSKTIDDVEVGTWLSKPAKAGYAYCVFCEKEVSYSTGGFRTLADHYKSKKHHRASRAFAPDAYWKPGTSDWSERSVKSATTSSDTDCWNPSAVAVKREPDSQPSSQPDSQPASEMHSQPASQPASQPDYWDPSTVTIKCEPASQEVSQSASEVDSQPTYQLEEDGPASQEDSQAASGQGIKTEPLDCHETESSDVLTLVQAPANKHGQVDFRCDFSYEPGCSTDVDSAGERSSPVPVGDPWRVERCQDSDSQPECEAALSNSLPEEENTLESSTPSVHLSSHKTYLHKLIDTQFVCDLCNKTFTLANNLKRHKMTMHSGLQFVCDVCNKAFKQPGNLKRHKLIHTGHKRFSCEVCHKAFIDNGHLKRHMLVHTGQKLFVCDVCSKAFRRASDLETHTFIHTGHREFVCDVCNKAFTRSSTLKTHKLIHTGQKQFVCDVCNKAFTQAGDVKKHKLIHIGIKQFVCDVCNKLFSQASSLNKHKRTLHKGEIAERSHVSTL